MIRATRAARNHDCRQKHADFTQHQNANKIDNEYFGTEVAQLESALLRDNCTNNGRHKHNHRHRADAHTVYLMNNCRRANTASAAALHLRAANGCAENVHRLDEIIAKGIDHATNRFKESRYQGRAVNMNDFRRSSRNIANGLKQSTPAFGLSFNGNCFAGFFQRGAQTLDQPGSRSIQQFHAGQINNRR